MERGGYGVLRLSALAEEQGKDGREEKRRKERRR